MRGSDKEEGWSRAQRVQRVAEAAAFQQGTEGCCEWLWFALGEKNEVRIYVRVPMCFRNPVNS